MNWEHGFEDWLHEHERLAAGVLLAIGFLLRAWAASRTFLNPDEALHFLVANKTSWALAYHASLTTAHPPLLIFVLHFWRALGTSEFVLRLPSVIAGTAFCWLLFRWMILLFGTVAGWIGFILTTFLPPLVILSAEVRQYTLLLLFMSAAMLLLERAFAKKSAGDMLLAYVCVLLAVLTHYSALFFAAALGVYGFFRWMGKRYPAGVKTAWGVGQLAVLALFDFLYRTHLAGLHSGSEITTQGWLYNSLFHRGQQSLLLFVFAKSFAVFQFVFGQLAVGDVAGVLFVIGLAYLIRSPQELEPTEHAGGMPEATPFAKSADRTKSDARGASWTIAILLMLPFLLTCAAAVAGVYPYGGTRHSAFLVPFAIAGVSLGLAWVVKQRTARGVVLALAIVAVSAAFGSPHRPYMTRQDQSVENMSRAMTFLRRNVPPQGVILVDYQTSLLLGHYLCEQQPMVFDRSNAGFLVFHCGGYRVLATGPEISNFTAESFLHGSVWSVMQNALGLKAGDPFWVMQEGWDINLTSQLRNTVPQFRDLEVQLFGRNIQMFRMSLEPEGPVPSSPQAL